jgi:hypothetical protein
MLAEQPEHEQHAEIADDDIDCQDEFGRQAVEKSHQLRGPFIHRLTLSP